MNRLDNNHNTMVIVMILLTAIVCFALGGLVFGLQLIGYLT